MFISALKFGDTLLYYAPDGTVAKGVVYQHKTFARRAAEWLFAASLALLIVTGIATIGRPYAERIVFSANTASRLLILEQLFATRRQQAAALLPLSLDDSDGTGETAAAGFDVAHAQLSIPRIKITAPVRETKADLSVLDRDLATGVIRWPKTAQLAAGDTTVILGHSSAPPSIFGSPYGSVFALLDKLSKDDEVLLSDGNKILRYAVSGRIIIDRENFNDTDILSGEGDRLVLVSCWPVGTTWKRIAVLAERVPQ